MKIGPKNVTSRVFTCFHYIHIEKNDPPTGGHVFSLIWTIFKLDRDINKTNVLTNFHDDVAKIVTFRPNKKNYPPPGSHKTNVLTKFHENWAKNMTSRRNMFSPIWTIFKLVRDINKTNVLTNFHDNWAKIENCPPPGSHVIQLTGTFFKLNPHIKETNKNAPPTGGHVFSPIWTIFKLVRDINKTNVLTNFHDDRAKIVTSRVLTRKTAPSPGSHFIQLTGTIFELKSHIKKQIEKCPAHWRPCFFTDLDHFQTVRNINKTNVLTNFHDDWTKIVTSRVFTRKTGGHVFQRTGTTFELNQHIIKTNILTNFELDRNFIGMKLLTKFHEDRKNKYDGQRPVTKAHLSNQIE
ncbi:hypothetical protein DPMN_049154 [Dreissena polymorpha]|uniref:Uncharacterized protein n=1 Tax=Dreissena polymorpha TaxID=45954 RepID=A0A9D4DAV3_DREPO|nr:hypothetical protein DPMN_049154 [Dreissena polymorpha]